MHRALSWGGIIGGLWGLLSYTMLAVAPVREAIRDYLGYRMTYLVPLLPAAWVAPIFGNWEARGSSGVLLPLSACGLAGALAGVFVGFLVREAG